MINVLIVDFISHVGAQTKRTWKETWAAKQSIAYWVDKTYWGWDRWRERRIGRRYCSYSFVGHDFIKNR